MASHAAQKRPLAAVDDGELPAFKSVPAMLQVPDSCKPRALMQHDAWEAHAGNARQTDGAAAQPNRRPSLRAPSWLATLRSGLIAALYRLSCAPPACRRIRMASFLWTAVSTSSPSTTASCRRLISRRPIHEQTCSSRLGGGTDATRRATEISHAAAAAPTGGHRSQPTGTAPSCDAARWSRGGKEAQEHRTQVRAPARTVAPAAPALSASALATPVCDLACACLTPMSQRVDAGAAREA